MNFFQVIVALDHVVADLLQVAGERLARVLQFLVEVAAGRFGDFLGQLARGFGIGRDALKEGR